MGLVICVLTQLINYMQPFICSYFRVKRDMDLCDDLRVGSYLPHGFFFGGYLSFFRPECFS